MTMDNLVLGTCILLVLLIVTHSIVSRRKNYSDQKNQPSVNRSFPLPILLSVLLLALYIAMAWYLFKEDQNWPSVSSLSILPLLIICPGIIFQASYIIYFLTKRKLLSRRIWLRLLSIVLGILLASQITSKSQTLAMKRFERTYQPLIEQIQANLPQACNPETPYKVHESLKGIHMGQLWHDKEHFILTFPGRSADVDGSTLYYYSKNKVWTIFHNDSSDGPGQLKTLLETMKRCKNNPIKGIK